MVRLPRQPGREGYKLLVISQQVCELLKTRSYREKLLENRRQLNALLRTAETLKEKALRPESCGCVNPSSSFYTTLWPPRLLQIAGNYCFFT